MSTLRIDPKDSADIDWPVGETYTMTVTGTVTAKTPDGGYNLNVTDVVEVETPEETDMEAVEEEMPMPTAEMMMGKGM